MIARGRASGTSGKVPNPNGDKLYDAPSIGSTPAIKARTTTSDNKNVNSLYGRVGGNNR
jgi:hypothetical protein